MGQLGFRSAAVFWIARGRVVVTDDRWVILPLPE
jgi:hypothetical protein